MEIVKVRKILLIHIPEESVNEILDYYVSMYFYDEVSIPIAFKFPCFKNIYSCSLYSCSLFGNHVYYTNPKQQWMNTLRLTDKEITQRDTIITCIRYWIHNSDLFSRICTPRDYIELRNCIERNLKRNIKDSPIWGEQVGKYYYRQIFFKEV